MSLKARRYQQKLLKQARKKSDPSAILHEVLKLYQSGNLELALKICQTILTVHSQHPDVLSLTGSIYLNLEQTAKSVKCLRAVTRILPDSAQAHYNLGTALTAHGEPDEAICSHCFALKLKPDYPEALFNLGNACRQADKMGAALMNYRKVLALVPDYPGAATNLASCLLELGQAQQALEACEAALQFHPADRDALAFKAIAASEVGDPDTAAAILDMDRLIQTKQFTVADGFESLAALNQALAVHVLAHPTLTREAHNIATRFGQQTGNLALEPKGPIAQLEAMIIAAYDEYMNGLADAADHPYVQQIPPLRKIDIWGTVLDNLGHQAAHMHRSAWVSGVYYVQLPDIMHDSNESQAGWIEFGCLPDNFICSSRPNVRLFKPQEGQMLLFPAFAYHRTIPFESNQKRISIAFDLLA